MTQEEKIESQKSQRWYGIDLIKGLLIICVFLGHVIPGEKRLTFPRYIIYSFHMPLFIGISGFLLNFEKMSLNIFSLIKKYWKRLGLPWVVAVALYFSLNNIGKRISFFKVINAYCHPWYHLWYITGFASYLLISVAVLAVLRNSRYKWVILLILATVISFVSEWGVLNNSVSNYYGNLILEYVQFDFRLRNYFFFCVGLYFRNRYESGKFDASMKVTYSLGVASVLSIIFVIGLFFFDYSDVENLMFYVSNTLILIFLYQTTTCSKMPRNKVLEFMGRYSLPLYLYHVFCKLLAMKLFEIGTFNYYIVSTLAFAILVFLVYKLKNVKMVNKVLFGNC